MAASGRFGRRRGASNQNLTMLIANLLREQQQANDKAAYDAWQNGGQYQGKPMTDDRMLGYIKSRRDGYATNDPLWDQWNDQLVQTKFSIGEQKIGLAFKEGKVSAGAVASWYRGQLNSIPKDSAFYRTVAGRAADWAKAVAGSARAAGVARARKALTAKYQQMNGRIADRIGLITAVHDAAVRDGLIQPKDSLTNADAQRLQQWLAQGVQIGNRVITTNDYHNALVSAYNGYSQMAPIYDQLGWDKSDLRKTQKQFFDGAIAPYNAVDDRAKYEAARQLYEQQYADAQGNPTAIDGINRGYVSTLQSIHDAAAKAGGQQANDNQFLGALANEINAIQTGKDSGPTVADLFQVAGATWKGSSDSAWSAQQAQQNAVNSQAIANGTAYYGQDENHKLGVQPDPFGSHLTDPSMAQTVIRVNGKPETIWMRGEAVQSAVLLDANGNTIGLDDPNVAGKSLPELVREGYTYDTTGSVVGYRYFDPRNGNVSYGVVNPITGDIRYTQDDPFASGIQQSGNDVFVIGQSGGVNTTNGQPTVVPVSLIKQSMLLPNGNLNGGLSPLPFAGNVSEGEALKQLIADAKTTTDAQRWRDEYNAYVHDQASPPNYTQGQQSLTALTVAQSRGGQALPQTTGSPVQNALTSVLSNINAGLLPLFTQPTKLGSAAPPTFIPPAPPKAPGIAATPTPTPTAKVAGSSVTPPKPIANLISAPISTPTSTTGATGALAGTIGALRDYYKRANTGTTGTRTTTGAL